MKKIAIIGSGIVGKLTAFLCSLNDDQVLIFGKRNLADIGAGSYAAPAMINVFSEIISEYEDLKYYQSLLEIGIESSELWLKCLEKINEQAARLGLNSIQMHSGMSVQCNENCPYELANFNAMKRLLKKYNAAYTIEESHSLVYGKEPGSQIASIHIPNEKYIDSGSCLKLLDQILASQKNVVIVERNVQTIHSEKNSVAIIDETRTRYDCEQALIAAGSESQDLLRQIDPSFPKIYRCHGIAFKIDKPNSHVQARRSVVFDSSCGVYSIDFPDHSYYGATGAFHNGLPHSSLNRIREYFHLDNHSLNHTRFIYGMRGVPLDKFPIIGPMQMAENVYCAAGLFRHGFTLAPYIANQFMKYVRGDHSQDEKNLFAPGRKILSIPNTQKVIYAITKGILDSTSPNPLKNRIWMKYLWSAKIAARAIWCKGAWHRLTKKLPKNEYYDADSVSAIYFQGFPDNLKMKMRK